MTSPSKHPRDRFDLIAQKKRLTEERDKRIADIRFRCSEAIREINEELEMLKPKKQTSLERYTEASDSPQRYCAGCNEPLLAATVENARLMVSSSKELQQMHADRDIRWTDLRSMHGKFCCSCCQKSNGDGSHSVWCYSVLSQSREYEEEKS